MGTAVRSDAGGDNLRNSRGAVALKGGWGAKWGRRLSELSQPRLSG